MTKRRRVYFELNYDRHGGRDWQIRTGRSRSRLTREILINVPTRTNLRLSAPIGKPKAIIVGIGRIHYDRSTTRIMP